MGKYGESVGNVGTIDKTTKDIKPKRGKYGSIVNSENIEAAISGQSSDKGFVERRLEARHEPTRLEKMMPGAAALMEAQRPKLPKGSPYAGEPVPVPTPMRALGEAIDIPINIGQAALKGIESQREMFKTTKDPKRFEPRYTMEMTEGQKDSGARMLKGLASNLATTVKHPFASFRERPIETAGDVYMGSQLTKGAVKGAGAIRKGVGKVAGKIFPKKSYYTIGQKIAKGVKDADKIAGQAVGAEKAAAKDIKMPVDTRAIVQKLENAKATSIDPSTGKSSLASSDIAAIDDLLATLKSNGGVVKPEALIAVKDRIRTNYFSPDKVKPALKPVSGYGEKVLIEGLDDVNNAIKVVDAKYGTGKWAEVNGKFSRIRKARNRLARKLGADETDLATRMKGIGKKIADGDEGYLDLMDDLGREMPELGSSYKGAVRDLVKLTKKIEASARWEAD